MASNVINNRETEKESSFVLKDVKTKQGITEKESKISE